MALLSITTAVLFLQLLLLLIVFMKDKKNMLNVSFVLLSAALLFWALFSFVFEIFEVAQTIHIVRLTMFFVVLQNIFFVLFSHALKVKKIVFNKKTWAYIVLSIATAIVALTPLMFEELEMGPRGFYPVAGPGILFFIVHAGASIYKGFNNLVRSLKTSKGFYKQQVQLIFVGSLVLWGLVPLTNFIFSIAFQTTFFGQFSPIYGFIFSSLIAYAIIKHRLFDIRLAIVRSLAYVLSITVLALVYGVLLFGVIDQFFPDTQMTRPQQSAYIGAAIMLAFTLHPLRLFFDKITGKLFYRDRYYTEDVLNRLGKVFVAKSNSFELLDDSLRVINNTLRVEFGRLIVLDGGDVYKVAHVGAYEDIDIDTESLSKFKRQVNILDELSDEEMTETLRSMRAYTLVRLETQDGLIGYLLLGAKQSGTIFTQQDINFLEILSQELAVAIQNAKSYKEIQAFSETLQSRVDEATTELQEKNEQLLKLDKTKDDFISMASHQLRTPLTTIKGYLSMMLEGDAGKLSTKQTEFVDMAFVSSKRMAHLISDMLNVSRISTGKLVIDKTKFDLVNVVESELDQLRRQAEARDIELSFHKPEEEKIEIELDEGKIRQVIMNFVDNAIYYAPEGKVTVYVKKHDDAVEFKVVDDGIGVSKEAQKQLFTKFFRAKNAQKIRPDGTGLGLYMAKQVIEAQDGEIIFESEKDEGSTFGFRFTL